MLNKGTEQLKYEINVGCRWILVDTDSTIISNAKVLILVQPEKILYKKKKKKQKVMSKTENCPWQRESTS